MAVVVFDPVQFKIAFPEFQAVPDARLLVLFQVAQGMLDNTDASIVVDLQQRTTMFWYLVAHLLTLYGTGVSSSAGGGGPSGVVGRLSTATEGTVTASYEFNIPASASAAWWNQTQYGATYWMMMAPYRSFRYVAAGFAGIGHAIDYRNRRRVPSPDDNSGTPGGA